MIMAGGKGERFWPKSRVSKPKQLLPIVSNNTMIEDTVKRLEGLAEYKNIFISTNESLLDDIRKILPQIPTENYILEPFGRDTAPAIAFGAVFIQKRDPGSVMVVLPADHLIMEKDIFQKDLTIAQNLARDTGCLITFGIKPARIETGYGYIELGEVINTEYDNHAYEVISFKEKPDYTLAKEYFQKGNFMWNSGMFIWTTNAILEAIEKYLPEMYNGLMEIEDSIGTADEKEVIRKNFETFPKISIDYGVMEKSDNVLSLKAQYTWDDVGSWSSLSRVNKMDENNNVIRSDWKGIDTKNSIVISDHGIISTIGINNLVIVKDGDAVLVADRSREQEVKKIVQELKDNNDLKKYIL